MYCEKSRHLIFSLIGVSTVLWQLLLPGYILTIDMVFGPNMLFPTLAQMTNSAYPVLLLRFFGTLLVSGWIVQKVLLFGMFVLMFYMPVRYYLFSAIENTYTRYFVGILYVVNPFVYERLLSGQWLVLAGYALLPGLVYALVELYREHSWRNIRGVFLWLFMIGLFSFHFLVMSTIIIILFALVRLVVFIWKKEWGKGKVFLLRMLVGGGLFMVASLYWLIPLYLNQGNPTLEVINQDHIEAFATASDDSFGLSATVALMYGFWLEHEPWIDRFVIPKDGQAIVWWGALVSLVSLIGVGLYRGLQDRSLRPVTTLLVLFAVTVFVFSSGVGDGPFQTFNQWLFDNVPFWRGFRDSQKWSGFLMMSYSMVAGLGLSHLLGLFQKRSIFVTTFVVACALPILYTPTLLFGLAGQLQVVNYPEAWQEVNTVLRTDRDCKAIFLPWQQYYALTFNDNRLTGNTAKSYFDCKIISGQNMELGTISSQGGNNDEYEQIEAVMMDNESSAKDVVELLRRLGVHYIIVTDDIVGNDPYMYPFLPALEKQKILQQSGIDLYSI